MIFYTITIFLSSYCFFPFYLLSISFTFPSQEAQRDQHRAQQELEDSQRIIELLNQKLHVLSDRAVELEAQTAQFHSLSPVLEKLMERFGFTSPDRAVQMMEDLQNKEISLFSEISSLQMENSALQGKVCLIAPEYFYVFQLFYIQFHLIILLSLLSLSSAGHPRSKRWSEIAPSQ